MWSSLPCRFWNDRDRSGLHERCFLITWWCSSSVCISVSRSCLNVCWAHGLLVVVGAMCFHVYCLSLPISLPNHCFSGSTCFSLVTLVCLPIYVSKHTQTQSRGNKHKRWITTKKKICISIYSRRFLESAGMLFSGLVCAEVMIHIWHVYRWILIKAARLMSLFSVSLHSHQRPALIKPSLSLAGWGH